MVRMCETMTLACATVLVAGTVATAADNSPRAAGQPTVKAEAPRSTGSAREAISNWNFDPSILGVGDDCATCPGWFNGNWDGQNGQGSHEGGGNQCGSKAADDFYLCDGFVYELRSISGVLITDSIIRRARLELYGDANGCPGQLLYTFDTHLAPQVGADLGEGFFVVRYTFNVADQDWTCPRISLKGGTYWVSLIGLTDGQGSDQSFFATAGNGVVKGSVARKITGICTGHWNTFSYPPFVPPCGCVWDSLEDCCIGCTDLAFTVCADNCKILIDNGTFQAPLAGQPIPGSRSERSIQSNRDVRSADDFVVPPCTNLAVCYVEGCIFTNCVNLLEHCDCGFFEIYENDCKFPAYDLATAVPANRTRLSNKVVDLGVSVQQVINGSNQTFRGYRLEFHDVRTTGPDICLTEGRQYWISIGLDYTFTFLERAYFCYNADCRRSCLIRFNPGATRGKGDDEWTSVNRDFSFLIATEPCVAAAGNSNPTCAADVDGDGSATVNDIFAFLTTWFAGCP